MSNRKTRDHGNVKLMELALHLLNRSKLADHIPLKPYSQERFMHSCGTPSCSLGLWAFLHPETWNMIEVLVAPSGLHKGYTIFVPVLSGEMQNSRCANQSAQIEFDLSAVEARELFGSDGCGHATNEIEAADYIKWFVAKRRVSANCERITTAEHLDVVRNVRRTMDEEMRTDGPQG
jgi:hypothetical protein